MSTNALSSWKSCDERFFWNLNVLSNLIDTPDIDSRWITPVTNMWISSEEISVKMKSDNGGIADEKFILSLISRRNRRRQGPRYFFLLFIYIVYLLIIVIHIAQTKSLPFKR
jgi:SacI homology domain